MTDFLRNPRTLKVIGIVWMGYIAFFAIAFTVFGFLDWDMGLLMPLIITYPPIAFAVAKRDRKVRDEREDSNHNKGGENPS